ncbi:MAG TPA: YbaK/EbsC family protein [Candidatus Baltobacteraceae bacterium]|jgi:Cys-tRNA(Pro) deacylase|nr:YbaK/EbsC family protein [Candidatus Baltobacteraceae bacterium]
MAVAKPLLKYLDKAEIKYEIVPHKKVYTAYDLAQTLGEKLDGIAKTLLVKVELPNVDKRGKYYILVIPASYRANFNKIKKGLNAKKVEMAVEKQLKKLNLNPGAITPFGGYHKIEVLLDKTLMRAKKVLVSAGAHTEALRIKVKDLHEKENATLGQFGDKAKIKLQKIVKKAKKAAKKAVKKARKILKKKKA